MTRTELLAASRRGILFSTPMVQAILAGKKTRTMRVMNPQPSLSDFNGVPAYEFKGHYYFNDEGPYIARKHFAHGWALMKPGDIVYVREMCARQFDGLGPLTEYRADWNNKDIKTTPCNNPYGFEVPSWRLSMFMQKAYARIFLRITDVKVQRPQELTEEEAISEGVSKLFDEMAEAEYREWRMRICAAQGPEFDPGDQADQHYTNYLWHGRFGQHGMGIKQSDAWPYQYSGYKSARDSFSSLWELINAKRGYGWDVNPWCFTYMFERVVPDDCD